MCELHRGLGRPSTCGATNQQPIPFLPTRKVFDAQVKMFSDHGIGILCAFLAAFFTGEEGLHASTDCSALSRADASSLRFKKTAPSSFFSLAPALRFSPHSR